VKDLDAESTLHLYSRRRSLIFLVRHHDISPNIMFTVCQAGRSFGVGVAESLNWAYGASFFTGLSAPFHKHPADCVDRRSTRSLCLLLKGATKNVDCWDSCASRICILCRDGLPRIAWVSPTVKTAQQPNPRSPLGAGVTPCFHVEDHRPSASESDR